MNLKFLDKIMSYGQDYFLMQNLQTLLRSDFISDDTKKNISVEKKDFQRSVAYESIKSFYLETLGQIFTKNEIDIFFFNEINNENDKTYAIKHIEKVVSFLSENINFTPDELTTILFEAKKKKQLIKYPILNKLNNFRKSYL
jgi:hypothetical protein